METFGEPVMIEPLQPNLRRTRKKGPSGHVAAGRKWDTSEKGRIWKAQTVKAKHELHDIIKKRTGLDVFANQRMTLKYAGLKRDGKTAEAKRIVEKVIANAKEGAKKETKKRTPKRQTMGSKQNSAERSKENSAAFSKVAEIPAETPTQPPPPAQPKIQPTHQLPAILPNPAEKGIPQIQPQPIGHLETDRVELPDFLD